MKFGRAFPRIIQAIWEADTNKGPIRVSNMDVTDTYHGGTLPPYHVVAFAYFTHWQLTAIVSSSASI